MNEKSTEATLEHARAARHWQCAHCGNGQGKLHELKTWPWYFSEILTGVKQFELRKNDRNFECGDTLLLREWDPDTKEYTGREIFKSVALTMSGMPGLQDGYMLMGLLPG